MATKRRASQGRTVISGEDSNGNQYATLDAMWHKELAEKDGDQQPTWYKKAVDYWQKSEPTVNGVLGGFENVSGADLKETRLFLEMVHRKHKDFKRHRCIDVGCGIGRVSINVLQHLYDVVDLLEPCEHLLTKAKNEMAPDHLGEAFLESLQQHRPAEERYDCFFIQWATLYLTDDDLIQTLRRCQAALAPGGFIIVKENITRDERFHIDKVDSSITRSNAHYKKIFRSAGLEVIHEQRQVDWPDELFPVVMYALR